MLLAAGIALWPHLDAALATARLLSAPAPSFLPVPVQGVGPEGLSDTWDDPRSGGRSHEGVDIFARRRTPVISTTDGIVARRGESGLGGRTVTILGPGRQRHYYAHLQQYGGQAVGDRVAMGEVIGFVGTSGNAPADAPHLHYGIYGAGGAINPYPLLTAPDSATGGRATSGDRR